MWILFKLVFAIAVALVILIGAMFAADWLKLSHEIDGSYDFDPASIPHDLDAYLESQEALVPNLRKELRKQIHWAGEPGKKQDLAIVYFHGFSGSNHELQPVPQQVAQELGANLFLGRWTGHGQDTEAMGEARGHHWMLDAAEALEIGQRLGDRVILMGTSFGGSMTTIAAADPLMAEKIDGIVFVAPNFALANWATPILTLPGIRTWGPWVAGEFREFEPKNELHERYWTPRYSNQATISLGQITKFVQGINYENISQPALFIFSDEDTVVKSTAIRAAIKRWGGSTEMEVIESGSGVDKDGHVITGDNLSPGSTELVIDRITRWVSAL